MLIIISGPSTIGKDSTWIKTCESCFGFKRIIPYTTRLKRENEIDGFDYNFISKEAFKLLIKNNRLLEWDYFNGNYYGTPYNDYSNDDFVIHALGRIALRIKQKKQNSFLIMLLPSNEDIIHSRLATRGYSSKDHEIRFEHLYEETDHSTLFDFIVPNAETVTEFEAENILQKIIDNKSAPI